MDKLPSIHLFPGDWMRDPVASCSLAAQGLWLRMMFVMHFSERYGYLILNGVPMTPASVARRCGASLDEYATLLDELDKEGIPRRSDGIIYSKRMVEDQKKRTKSKRDGTLGGNPNLIRGVNPMVALPDVDVDVDVGLGISGKGEAGETVRCPAALLTPDFREAWQRWGEHRASIRKPLTWPMIRQQFKQMEKMGVARAVAMIEHTISRGWWGLREDEPRSTGANGAHAPPPRRQSARDRDMDMIDRMFPDTPEPK